MTALAVALIFVNKLGAIGNVVFFSAVFAMIMLRSAKAGLIAINISFLALCANTAFVTKTAVWTVARFVILFVFSGRFVTSGNAAWIRTPSYAALTLFVLIAAICSILSGYYVHIALLKLASFWIGMTGFFACIHAIRKQRRDTTEWFISQAAALCILSTISLMTGVATNFKAHYTGLYNLGLYHSQTMGPIGALTAVYLVCVYLFAGHRNRWICLPLICILLYFVGLTGSRTGMGTLLLGVATATLLGLLWRRKGHLRLRLNISRPKVIFGSIAIVLVAASLDAGSHGLLTRKFMSFVAKKGAEVETVTIADAVTTRAGVVEHSYENFKESPIFGIGFQVSKADYFIKNASIFSAPIEKGFLPVAILEEVGVVGAFFFVVFVLATAAQLVRDRNIAGISMFMSLLISNLGEASLFALAGPGAYGWILVMGGILLGDRCHEQMPHHTETATMLGNQLPHARGPQCSPVMTTT